MEMIGCAETLVGNNHHTLSYISEEHRSHLLRSGSHKSQMVFDVLKTHNAFIFNSQGSPRRILNP